MSDLIINDPLAQRLRSLAEREHRSVDEVLETLLDQYPADQDQNEEDDNPLLTMLRLAEAAKLTFTENDVVDRSREILNTEYPDYLLKRMHENDAD